MACNTSEGSRKPAPPPILGKNRKERKWKKSRLGRQNKHKTTPQPPLAQGLNLRLNALANTIFYGEQFKFNDKAIIELELVVTKCSVCKCVTLSCEQ